MRRLTLVLVCWTWLSGQAPVVDQVREAAGRGDFAAADRLVEAYGRQAGENPQLALAISWQARGALAAKRYELAESYAGRARDLALKLLKRRRLDADKDLPLALGAAIEVQAQVMAARGEVSSAVAFLETERRKYAGTSVVERIAKNINLLSLTGKRAPPLEAAEWIGVKPPALAAYRGKPVLVFFWAHWCPDCKAQAPILSNLMRTYGPRGLMLLAPTRYYGYVEGGQEAPRAKEKAYIQQVRDRDYPGLARVPVPLSNAIFETYGCSSTPTLALIDKQGIVRWYHPGNATEAELIRQIEAVL
jgi:thiol-disulfide isomerase/thioredoxin